ncbi:MAG: hypothetical protein OEY59_00275 [Deltaproteobacteria bacterium]|nr:hypothetical protein [Deltaproteobacteria bacterium]
MSTFIAALIIIGLAMLAMSVGMILSNKCIQGSCGNKNLLAKIQGTSACDFCDKKQDCSESAS